MPEDPIDFESDGEDNRTALLNNGVDAFVVLACKTIALYSPKFISPSKIPNTFVLGAFAQFV